MIKKDAENLNYDSFCLININHAQHTLHLLFSSSVCLAVSLSLSLLSLATTLYGAHYYAATADIDSSATTVTATIMYFASNQESGT